MLKRRILAVNTTSSSAPTTTSASTSTTISLSPLQFNQFRFAAPNSTRTVYSVQPNRLKQHNRKGSNSGKDFARWKASQGGQSTYRQQPTGSGKANPNMADFANAKVKHWHMWLMVGGCAVGGYFAGQYVSIDPKKLNPKDTNTGDRRVGKLDLKSVAEQEKEKEQEGEQK